MCSRFSDPPRKLESKISVQWVGANGVTTSCPQPQKHLCTLREVNGILLAAVAFGWLAEAPLAAERDRLGGILYGLQRR